jgi:hypothetical protein
MAARLRPPRPGAAPGPPPRRGAPRRAFPRACPSNPRVPPPARLLLCPCFDAGRPGTGRAPLHLARTRAARGAVAASRCGRRHNAPRPTTFYPRAFARETASRAALEHRQSARAPPPKTAARRARLRAALGCGETWAPCPLPALQRGTKIDMQRARRPPSRPRALPGWSGAPLRGSPALSAPAVRAPATPCAANGAPGPRAPRLAAHVLPSAAPCRPVPPRHADVAGPPFAGAGPAGRRPCERAAPWPLRRQPFLAPLRAAKRAKHSPEPNWTVTAAVPRLETNSQQ